VEVVTSHRRDKQLHHRRPRARLIAQRPDAILIYAGHNEYYGALGAGSTETLGRCRLVRLLPEAPAIQDIPSPAECGRNGRLLPRTESPFATPDPHPSRMETVVRDQRITLGGKVYERGNDSSRATCSLLSCVSARRRGGLHRKHAEQSARAEAFRSLPSPADSSRQPCSIRRAALSRADIERARLLFAPLAILTLYVSGPGRVSGDLKRAATKTGRTTSVEEAFDSAPNMGYQARISSWSTSTRTPADIFFSDALTSRRCSARVPGTSDLRRLAVGTNTRAGWISQRSTTGLFITRSKRSQPVAISSGERATELSRQRTSHRFHGQPGLFGLDGVMKWAQAKTRDSATIRSSWSGGQCLAEYGGLIRREPHSEAGYRLAGAALLDAKQPQRARPFLEKSYAIEPTPFSAMRLASSPDNRVMRSVRSRFSSSRCRSLRIHRRRCTSSLSRTR